MSRKKINPDPKWEEDEETIPEVDIVMESTAITAAPRRVKARVTPLNPRIDVGLHPYFPHRFKALTMSIRTDYDPSMNLTTCMIEVTQPEHVAFFMRSLSEPAEGSIAIDYRGTHYLLVDPKVVSLHEPNIDHPTDAVQVEDGRFPVVHVVLTDTWWEMGR